MEDGNGKDKPIEQPEAKTEEILAQERQERYIKNPDSFVECSEIVACCIREPNVGIGFSILISKCKRTELDIAQAELNHKMDMVRCSMDMEAKIALQSKIIPAKHGILDFGRRHK